MKLRDLNESIKAKKGLGLSLSKIKMFENCEWRYYLQYFKKEKFDKADYNPKFFKIGQFAHKYIESKIKGIDCVFNSSTMTDEEKETVKNNCQNVFKNKYISDLIKHGGESEKGFSLYIDPTEEDGLSVAEKYSRNADFSGYIDFFTIKNGVAHIIDWKTGSKKGKDDETFMQLMLYAKAVAKLENVKKFKLSFFYLDHDELVTRDFTLDNLNKHIEKIVKKGFDIPRTDNPKLFKPNPGTVCKYCPYSKVRSSDGKIPCEFAKIS